MPHARAYFIDDEAECSDSESDSTCSTFGAEDTPADVDAGASDSEHWSDVEEDLLRTVGERRLVHQVADASPPRVRTPPAAAAAAAGPDSHGGLDDLVAAVDAVRGPRHAMEVDQHPVLQQGVPVEIADLPDDVSRQATRFVFTINNPGDYRPVWDETKMAYLVWQTERAPSTGTVHIQGYLRLKRKARFRTIQPLLGGHAAIYAARGNEQQCRDYCTKEDTRVSVGEEHGDFKPDAGKQGHRSDLDSVIADCKLGKSLAVIAADHPREMIKFHAGIQVLYDLIAPQPPIQRDVKVLVMWGDTRVGKTHRVMTDELLRGDGGLFCVIPGRGPFDMYRGEKTILFDEFDYEKWSIFDMNRYLDKWQLTCDCRFHNKSAAWTRVIICANSSPMSWYPNASQPVVDAFRRRLGSGCRHVTSRLENIHELPPMPDFGYLIQDGDLPAGDPPGDASSPIYDLDDDMGSPPQPPQSEAPAPAPAPAPTSAADAAHNLVARRIMYCGRPTVMYGLRGLTPPP